MALIASSVASVSSQPPLLVHFVSALASASAVLQRGQTVVVHFLDAQDVDVAKLGATSGIDRFTQAQTWTKLATGETVYDHVRAWVRCEIVERFHAGESTVLIARPVQSRIERDVQLASRAVRWCTTTGRGTIRAGIPVWISNSL